MMTEWRIESSNVLFYFGSEPFYAKPFMLSGAKPYPSLRRPRRHEHAHLKMVDYCEPSNLKCDDASQQRLADPGSAVIGVYIQVPPYIFQC